MDKDELDALFREHDKWLETELALEAKAEQCRAPPVTVLNEAQLAQIDALIAQRINEFGEMYTSAVREVLADRSEQHRRMVASLRSEIAALRRKVREMELKLAAPPAKGERVGDFTPPAKRWAA